MSPSSMRILCRYQYDPLDRLVGLRPLESLGTQRFYQKSYLANEIEDQVQRTIIRNEAQPLAQRQSMAGVTESILLATDQQHSVLKTLTGTNPQQMAYTAYGHHPVESGLSSLLGFNGERPDSITGHYLLGQGKRAFNPVLMRFNSPDELSPFGEGGINPYAYCANDPINRYDPTGNIPVRFFRPWEQLKALAPSSITISRSNPNPILSGLLDAPIPTSSRSTSTLISQTPTTSAGGRPEIRKQPASKMSQSGAFKKAQRKDAARFDTFRKNNPNAPIPAFPKLQKKIDSAREQLVQRAQGGAPAKELGVIVAKMEYGELRIKSQSIRQIEAKTPSSME